MPLENEMDAGRGAVDSRRGAETETPDEGQARPPDEVLEEMLREVKHIARNQEYTEFSIWNIFGGLLQCVVLFLLFWHAYKDTPDLMWAVVLQLLALTCFVVAKR